jgi:hypothetical protein
MLFSNLFLVAFAVSQVCITPADTLCIYAKVEGDSVLITVHSVARGWAAIGQGNTMATATIYNGWKNSTGGYTVAAMKASGHVRPVVTDDIATAIPLQVAAPAWANLAYSYSRPLSSLAVSQFIYAFSDIAPATIDSKSSGFEQHTSAARLSPTPIDLQRLAAPTAPTASVLPSKNGALSSSSNVLIIVALAGYIALFSL